MVSTRVLHTSVAASVECIVNGPMALVHCRLPCDTSHSHFRGSTFSSSMLLMLFLVCSETRLSFSYSQTGRMGRFECVCVCVSVYIVFHVDSIDNRDAFHYSKRNCVRLHRSIEHRHRHSSHCNWHQMNEIRFNCVAYLLFYFSLKIPLALGNLRETRNEELNGRPNTKVFNG